MTKQTPSSHDEHERIIKHLVNLEDENLGLKRINNQLLEDFKLLATSPNIKGIGLTKVQRKKLFKEYHLKGVSFGIYGDGFFDGLEKGAEQGYAKALNDVAERWNNLKRVVVDEETVLIEDFEEWLIAKLEKK